MTRLKKATKLDTTAIYESHAQFVEELCEELLDIALERCELDINCAKKYGVEDYELSDSLDILQIARYVQTGTVASWVEARKQALKMDTAVREQLPDRFWSMTAHLDPASRSKKKTKAKGSIKRRA